MSRSRLPPDIAMLIDQSQQQIRDSRAICERVAVTNDVVLEQTRQAIEESQALIRKLHAILRHAATMGADMQR